MSMRGEKFRSKRVGELLRTEIAALLAHGLKDPRLDGAIISILEVRVDSELSVADIYTSVLPEDRRPGVLAALQHAAGFLRTRLSKELHIRLMPELRFLLDTTIADGMRLQQLITDVNRPAGEAEAE